MEQGPAQGAPGLWNCECCKVPEPNPAENKVQTKKLTLAPALLAADKIICKKEEISIELYMNMPGREEQQFKGQEIKKPAITGGK